MMTQSPSRSHLRSDLSPTLGSMSDYATAWDALASAIGAAEGKSSGSITDIGHMTIDQQLKVAEIAALLSISQELSQIHHEGIYPNRADDE